MTNNNNIVNKKKNKIIKKKNYLKNIMINMIWKPNNLNKRVKNKKKLGKFHKKTNKSINPNKTRNNNIININKNNNQRPKYRKKQKKLIMNLPKINLIKLVSQIL